MPTLIRNSISFRASAAGYLVLLLIWLGVDVVLVEAAPMTFRFDATVTGVFAGSPFDLPLNFQTGDVIRGRVTFDPTIGTPLHDNAFDSNQTFPLELDTNGILLVSAQYSIRAINDSPILDSSLPVDIVDDMVLRCSPSAPRPCSPAVISLPGSDPFRITARMTLLGASSIFDVPHVSPNPSIWNSFQFERSLLLTLDNLQGGSLAVNASVGNFVLVPEPSTSFIAVVALTFWTVLRERKR